MAYNYDYFQGFRDWLMVDEHKTPERASVIKSNLWELENITKGIDLPFKDDKGNFKYSGLPNKLLGLHTLYSLLAEVASPKVMKINVEYTKDVLGLVFREITTKANPKVSSNKTEHKNRKTKYNDYKTALILYCQFLSKMYGKFTLEDLEKEGKIVRERKRNSNIPADELIPARYFMKGLVRQLLKYKLILGKDPKTIISVLDAFHEFIEEIVADKNENYRTKNIYRTISLITFNNSCVVTDWEVILADNMDIAVDGSYLSWSDVAGVCYNPLKNTLEIYNDEGWVNSIILPSLAVESSIYNELSAYVMVQPPLREQINILNELRNVCYGMKELMQPYLKFKKVKDKGCGYEDKLSSVMNSLNHKRLAQLSESAYELIKQYGKGFQIELAIQ